MLTGGRILKHLVVHLSRCLFSVRSSSPSTENSRRTAFSVVPGRPFGLDTKTTILRCRQDLQQNCASVGADMASEDNQPVTKELDKPPPSSRDLGQQANRKKQLETGLYRMQIYLDFGARAPMQLDLRTLVVGLHGSVAPGNVCPFIWTD